METPGTNSVSLYRRTTDSSSTEDDSEGEDESSWKRQSTNKAKKMLAEGGYDFSNSSTAVQPQESFTFGKKKVSSEFSFREAFNRMMQTRPVSWLFSSAAPDEGKHSLRTLLCTTPCIQGYGIRFGTRVQPTT